MRFARHLGPIPHNCVIPTVDGSWYADVSALISITRHSEAGQMGYGTRHSYRARSAITDRSLDTAQESEKAPKVDGLIVPQGHMTAVVCGSQVDL